MLYMTGNVVILSECAMIRERRGTSPPPLRGTRNLAMSVLLVELLCYNLPKYARIELGNRDYNVEN